MGERTGMDNARDMLVRLWRAGVAAVEGRQAVAHALDAAPVPRPDLVLAVGKAAVPMARAALDRFGRVPALAVTKHGHGDGHGDGQAGHDGQAGLEVIEAGHPLPDAGSLRAGAALLERVAACPPGSHLLLLISGGASALAEAPVAGLTLDDLAAETRALIASGADIATMNARRRQLSRIKGGRLLQAFGGARVTVLAISDVQGDDIAVIGSGTGLVPEGAGFAHETRIVASNAVARAAVAAEAQTLGLTVQGNAENLYCDVGEAAAMIGARLRAGPPGLWIWGGEPTVVLPETPGRGGRNQALALMVARGIAGQEGAAALIAGTDGTDGPTGAAGAFVDGASWGPGAGAALAAADSGTWLAANGLLFEPGPTGTNVMDLALGLKAG
ncbi:glycerate kinase [Rhodosalinus sp.]|uniref:glycerate kinase type-2 family protein n=1 Tax=Rhodosalinus sp. TaxID=2047741 RepID=UPI0039795E27